MLIRSQNKEVLVHIEQGSLVIGEKEEGVFHVGLIYPGNWTNALDLGSYSSMEQAKQILTAIETAYESERVYRMPEE